mmetsp:Transcript_11443/g.16185  ORF Transcript_11443/g.16185 Transcript_11443/m.16185 type:complete len:133 (-) Transcript_11443:2152-2550(-)
MEDSTTPVQETPAATENQNSQTGTNVGNENATRGKPSLPNNHTDPVLSTPRDFKGATPNIGGILALRNKNMTKEGNYDQFCEKLNIYIMNNVKNGDAVVEVTKNPSANIIEDYTKTHKPKEFTDEEKKLTLK